MKMIACVFLTAGGVLSAGELPQLVEKPWLGWFVGVEGRHFNFGVKDDGEAVLIPINDHDEPVSPRHWIEIEPVIEEILPSGRVRTKQHQDDGWETATAPTAALENVSYRGTVTDGARFEAHFEVDGSEIRGGGRLLDKGGLTEHPVRFAIRVKIPNVYVYVDDEERLEELAGDDRIRMERADGERLRFDGTDVVWAEKEHSGPGIRTARIDLTGYDGAKADLDSGEAGLFEFWNGSKRELHKGFTLGWKPDPEKNPDGEARFTLKFR